MTDPNYINVSKDWEYDEIPSYSQWDIISSNQKWIPIQLWIDYCAARRTLNTILEQMGAAPTTRMAGVA